MNDTRHLSRAAATSAKDIANVRDGGLWKKLRKQWKQDMEAA